MPWRFAVLELGVFFAVTLPLVATPGASTAVVLRNSIAGGTRAGLFTAVGCNTASVCYGLLTAFGFAAALQAWPSIWLVLRAAGVAYLAWLGFSSLARAHQRRWRRGARHQTRRSRSWHSASSGFLTNVLNPSLAAFYLVLLPQFIPRDAPFTRQRADADRRSMSRWRSRGTRRGLWPGIDDGPRASVRSVRGGRSTRSRASRCSGCAARSPVG